MILLFHIDPLTFYVSSNFLSILSYWTAFFIVVVAEEHFIFRRKGGILSGYDLEAYDDISRSVPGQIMVSLLRIHVFLTYRLPIGAAGIFAGCCGAAGAVVGMAEVWYVGPIGAKLGPFGGDLGFEVRCRILVILLRKLSL